MKSREFTNISAFQYRDMRAWCMEQMGPGGWTHGPNGNELKRWDSWSHCDNLTPNMMMTWRGEAFFDFHDERDYNWFSLRWS
jgi:hypothetical protein